ncbi:hypothetical protein HETIRDRAFT_461285 [Heterobasidion irregulare TC 32-1]|uniref:Polyketide synthase-like phosphopantetheine-binding domain-containing protein n=1 Tax=Heterobasidion irregulare (strain TC 32-1) TaxID=747525 RepID=W4JQI2_HETIT|nr:uncharacterized protein HETIRDRAFT_461285 [Heterobasidion irregulare TC 32-1]ETW75335.1 hypothetical protein HETIRDRAFT_461285 [Heterobasidion irregulare TC 32-1]
MKSQATRSTTFTVPPLDGTLSIPQVFDFHAQESRDHPLFVFEDAAESLAHVTYDHFMRAAHRAARTFTEYQMNMDHALSSSKKVPIFAVLAAADSMTYVATMIGIIRAGYCAFLVSPRNSPPAIAHLLSITQSDFLLTSADTVTQDIVHKAVDILQKNGGTIAVRDIPRFEELFHDVAVSFEPLPQMQTPSMDDVAIILHSSGSTNFPKPIPLTHRALLEWGKGTWYGEVDLCGEVLGCQSLALFHAMGVITPFWAAASGMTLAVFKPAIPVMIPNPHNFLESVVATRSNMVFCVPSYIEAWQKDPRAVSHLAKLKRLLWCGGPLSKDAGDALAANGVFVTPYYAATETGGMSCFVLEQPLGPDWEYFKISSHCEPVFLPQDDDSGAFEAVFMERSTHTPSVFNATIDGRKGFATGDLLIPYPRLAGYYKVLGRADDQIMLSTGEKTNPAPIEKILVKHPLVANAVIFGRGRFQNGVIIDPTPGHHIDPEDTEALAQFRREIWPVVEEANAWAPSHSRLFREASLMIILSSPSKPFSFTPKGTPRRKIVIEDYAPEIQALYTAVEESSQDDIVPPGTWDLNGITQFIRTTVRKVVGREDLADGDDIFQLGADSLSATWIRNSILLALRKSSPLPSASIRALPIDFVFNFPSIANLSAFIFGVVFMAQNSTPSSEPEAPEEADTPEQTFQWPTLGQVGQTIIKLREGRLGAGGTVHAFGPLQEKFRSALWVIQVTPDTPLTSLAEQTSFYYRKIKEQQSSGPYRLSAFSATSIIAIALAKMFEDNGDEVVQLAMLDHFPTMFQCPVYGLDGFDLDDPVARRAFHKVCMEGICDALRRDGGGKVPRRHQLANELWDAFNGLPTPEFSQTYWKTVEKFMNLMVEFMLTQGGRGSTGGKRSMEPLLDWMKAIKAPVSVYMASEGMIRTLPERYRADWADLGTRMCFPDARIIRVNGGHFDILANDELIKSLQGGYH